MCFWDDLYHEYPIASFQTAGILRISGDTLNSATSCWAITICNGRIGSAIGLHDLGLKSRKICWLESLIPTTNLSCKCQPGLMVEPRRKLYTKPPNEPSLNSDMFSLPFWILLDFGNHKILNFKIKHIYFPSLCLCPGVHLTLTCVIMHGHGCYLFLCDEGMSAGSNWQWECVFHLQK